MKFKSIDKIARNLRMSESVVKKALSNPMSVSETVRFQVLSLAHRVGESWIQQKFPLQAILISGAKYDNYAQAVFQGFLKRYSSATAHYIRYDDPDEGWAKVSQLCMKTPSTVFVLGDTPKQMIEYLSMLKSHVIYACCMSAPPAQRIHVDFYDGTVKLAKRLRERGFKSYFAAHFQGLGADVANDKLLGYLSTIQLGTTDHMYNWAFNLDVGYPNAKQFSHNAALITSSVSTAQHLHSILPSEIVVACIDLVTALPMNSEILYSTVLPDEMCAEMINTLKRRLNGDEDKKYKVVPTPRF